MKTVQETLELILSCAPLLPVESVDLATALRRVLREEVLAEADSPLFDCSAMDGYAVRTADVGQEVQIVGIIQAGDGKNWQISPGEAARIFTGARIPAGADAVLMQEQATLKDERLLVPLVTGGENIRRQGENCLCGASVVPAGRKLGPIDLAALASCGMVRPVVSRKPRIVHFVLGNELADPTEVLAGSQIRDCNSTLMAAFLAEHGAELTHQSRLPDDLAAAVQAVQAQPEFDLLLLSGGASVGDFDFARPLLGREGFEILAHHINLRPGKPLLVAQRGGQLAFGLPGNPVSHAVIFHLFLAPLLAAMLGAETAVTVYEGKLAADLPSSHSPRETYWPCRATWQAGAFRLQPLRFQSSGDISGVAGANALLRIAPNSPGTLNKDDSVEFLLIQ